MEPIEYLRAFRRRWTVVAAFVVVALAVGFFTTQTVGKVKVDRVYRAAALIIDTTQTGFATTTTSVDDVYILSVFARTSPVAKRAARILGGSADPDALSAAVTATPDPETGTLGVAATAPRAGRAEKVALAYAQALLGFARDERARELNDRIRALRNQAKTMGRDTSARLTIELQLSQLRSELVAPVGFRMVGSPNAELLGSDAAIRAPTSRVGRLLVAGVAGLFGGILLVLVLERLDRRIRSKQAAELHFDLPVLGEVPVIPRRFRRGVTSVTRPKGPPAEAFRLLAAAVQRATENGHGEDGEERTARTIIVTSAGPAEGKTTVTANLGAALAERGDRVLMLSCDMRRPALGRFLGVPEEPGLADAIRSKNGHSTLAQYRRETDVYRLSMVSSGAAPSNPGEMLSSERMRTLLAEGRRNNDVILLDTPPILVASDAAPLIPEADAVLIVASAGTTTAEIAARVTDTLRRLGAPLVGVALNRSAEMPRPANYHPSRYESQDGAAAWSSQG